MSLHLSSSRTHIRAKEVGGASVSQTRQRGKSVTGNLRALKAHSRLVLLLSITNASMQLRLPYTQTLPIMIRACVSLLGLPRQSPHTGWLRTEMYYLTVLQVGAGCFLPERGPALCVPPSFWLSAGNPWHLLACNGYPELCLHLYAVFSLCPCLSLCPDFPLLQ